MPRAVLSALAASALLASPTLAQWNVRISGNYQDSHLGGVSSRSSSEELTARHTYGFSEEASLGVTARLRHTYDFEARDRLYRGSADLDLRTRHVAAFYRVQPDQRQAVNLPSTSRREERTWGGTFRTNSGPVFLYQEGRRKQRQQTVGKELAETWDRRLGASWSVRGVDLDYTFGQSRNSRRADSLLTDPVTGRTTRDHTGGARFMRAMYGIATLAAGYRRADSQATQTGRTTRLVSNQADGQATLKLWAPLQANASAGWTESRTTRREVPPGYNRSLDATLGITYRPWDLLGLSLVRSFQEAQNAGQTSRSDHLRAGIETQVRPTPELRLTGGFSHSRSIARTNTAAPSDQATVGLSGQLRPGADLSVTLAGTHLEGVPAAMRYQVTQGGELRLAPSPAVVVRLGTQSYGLDRQIRLWSPRQGTYRADVQAQLPRGATMSLGYATRIANESGSGKGQMISGTISTPWRGGAFSWNGTATHAGVAESTSGRSWGYASSISVRLRIVRLADISISQVRTLPVIGATGYTWTVSVQQSLR